MPPLPPKRSGPDATAAGASASSEEGRAFLQERLALFGRVGFLLSLGFYVVANLAMFLHPGQHLDRWIGDPFHLGHLAATLMLAGVWLTCRRGRLSPGSLKLIDAGGLAAVCLGFSGPVAWADVALYERYGLLPEFRYGMLLAVTHAVVGRAVLVPSAPGRTLWIGAACTVPAAYAAYAFHLASKPGPVAALLVTVAAAWGALAVALSTVASRVIYGLREEVREARRLGQYTLEEKLGQGGMGEVYKARHAMLRRPTAVKLLPPGEGGESRLKRFEREVQLTSRLTHPNTVSIFDYGRTPDGVFYYAMEYLDGISLEDLVADDGPQPPARVVHVLRQVCGSLEEAHAIGLIHRDVKPANVILCERGGVPDVAKVFDFGLVKELEGGEAEALTRENVITGTPLYLAPEAILSSDAVDARADIYAVGAVGYFLLTGRPVFDGRTLVEVCGHHLHTTPVPPSQRLGGPLPGGLEEVVLRCLEKDPARRPRTVRELGEALVSAGAGSWTAEDARAWWAVRGARLRERRPEEKGRDASLLSVDWDRRAVSSEG